MGMGEISRTVFVIKIFVFEIKEDRSEEFQHRRNRGKKSNLQPQRLSRRKTNKVGVFSKSMEENVSRRELSTESKAACYKSSCKEDSRSEKIIDDVAQSGLSNVMGHTPHCSGLRCERWR